ncbi:MAG: hypothetical protein ACI8W7_001599 [Gammaproteobacteria bacterium]|jgi:hypothetical protein
MAFIGVRGEYSFAQVIQSVIQSVWKNSQRFVKQTHCVQFKPLRDRHAMSLAAECGYQTSPYLR